MTKEEIIELAEKVALGTASEEEIQYFNRLCDAGFISEDGWDENLYGNKSALKASIKQAIWQQAGVENGVIKMRWFKWAAAAAVILMISVIGVLMTINHAEKDQVAVAQTQKKEFKNDVAPGQTGAILTLADGQKILLDSAGDGTLAQQGNASVIKNNGELVYNTGGNAAVTVYNTMTTPKGRQFNLVLADGSKVWLNAESSITFPTQFSGKERKVTITGEAYFEVAHNAVMPFIVEKGSASIRVLGTHFNVNAYDDESVIGVTLLEGSVNVGNGNKNVLIKPGQQARLGKTGNVQVANNVDLEEIVAWKDGKFQFENANVQTVMRQLGRWYDMEIEYSGVINKHFGGTISRNVNLSKVLDMLQKTGEVKFTIDGKKIIVQP